MGFKFGHFAPILESKLFVFTLIFDNDLPFTFPWAPPHCYISGIYFACRVAHGCFEMLISANKNSDLWPPQNQPG